MRRLVFLILVLALASAASAEAGQPLGIPCTEPQAATLTGELFTPSARRTVSDRHSPPRLQRRRPCGEGLGPVAPGGGIRGACPRQLLGAWVAAVCGNPRPLMGDVRAHDVFAAAARLKTLDSVDGNRIATIGFLHDGWTALWAWCMQGRHPEARIKALIALYPACGGGLPEDQALPLIMLLGGQDDWTPAEPCLKLAETAHRAGRTVSAILYPDARYAFDAANLRGRVHVAAARGGKGAEYNPKAHDDAEKQVRQFLETQLGPGR